MIGIMASDGDEQAPVLASTADVISDWLGGFFSLFRPGIPLDECRAIVDELFVPAIGSFRVAAAGDAAPPLSVDYDALPRHLHTAWNGHGRARPQSERAEVAAFTAAEFAPGTLSGRGEMAVTTSYPRGARVVRRGTVLASFAPSGRAITVLFEVRSVESFGSPPPDVISGELGVGRRVARSLAVAGAIHNVVRDAFEQEPPRLPALMPELGPLRDDSGSDETSDNNSSACGITLVDTSSCGRRSFFGCDSGDEADMV